MLEGNFVPLHRIYKYQMIIQANMEHIRPVTLDDARAIVDIYNYFVTDTTVSFETQPLTVEEMADRIRAISVHFPYFVYEEDGKILGYCCAHLWKERAAYAKTLETTIYMHNDARRRGIGTLMVNHLVDLCRKQGYRALIACITAENEASIRMHEKIGFRRVSEFRQVGRKFGRWLDVVDMELLLD